MSTDQHTANIQAFREYAKQGILAASAINSGAILAALASSQSLIGHPSVAIAFKSWVAGLAVATLCWFCAYMSNYGYTHKVRWLETVFTWLGLVAFIVSVCLFAMGGWWVSEAFIPVT